jgi:hypothetical protein
MPKKLWPLPVQGIFENPDYIALPVAGRGMLWSLFEHFWRTDCKPLPIADDQLFAVARAHRPTWRHHRETILRIFNASQAELAAYKHARDNRLTHIKFAQKAGAATTNAIRRARAIEVSLPSTETPQGPLIPHQSPDRYRTPKPPKAPASLLT